MPIGLALLKDLPKQPAHAILEARSEIEGTLARRWGIMMKLVGEWVGIIWQVKDKIFFTVTKEINITTIQKVTFEGILSTKRLPLLIDFEETCGRLVGIGASLFPKTDLNKFKKAYPKRVIELNYYDGPKHVKTTVIVATDLIPTLWRLKDKFDIYILSRRDRRFVEKLIDALHEAVWAYSHATIPSPSYDEPPSDDEYDVDDENFLPGVKSEGKRPNAAPLSPDTFCPYSPDSPSKSPTYGSDSPAYQPVRYDASPTKEDMREGAGDEIEEVSLEVEVGRKFLRGYSYREEEARMSGMEGVKCVRNVIALQTDLGVPYLGPVILDQQTSGWYGDDRKLIVRVFEDDMENKAWDSNLSGAEGVANHVRERALEDLEKWNRGGRKGGFPFIADSLHEVVTRDFARLWASQNRIRREHEYTIEELNNRRPATQPP
ncbi:hypothetical protein HK097_003275, partial [Rhizophlyctis rosea]